MKAHSRLKFPVEVSNDASLHRDAAYVEDYPINASNLANPFRGNHWRPGKLHWLEPGSGDRAEYGCDVLPPIAGFTTVLWQENADTVADIGLLHRQAIFT